MDKIALKKKRFSRRKLSIKRKLKRGPGRLRLCINRHNRSIYAQIIDDDKGHTVVAMSTLSKDFPGKKNKSNIEAAKILGKIFAEKATKAGVKKVVFDRNGFLYHGKIKAFAESARENGLEF